MMNLFAVSPLCFVSSVCGALNELSGRSLSGRSLVGADGAC